MKTLVVSAALLLAASTAQAATAVNPSPPIPQPANAPRYLSQNDLQNVARYRLVSDLRLLDFLEWGGGGGSGSGGAGDGTSGASAGGSSSGCK